MSQKIKIEPPEEDIFLHSANEEVLAQRVAQLVLINDIGNKITGVLDLAGVLDRAAHLLQERFSYHHVALFLLDGNVARLKAIAGSYVNYFPENHCQQLDKGIIGWVATHGKGVVANNVAHEPRYVSLIAEHSITQSELCLPIRVTNQTVGVLDIQSPSLAAFDQNDIIAMETLVDQIAMAIENARLFEQAQLEIKERKRIEAQVRQRNQELTLLNRASQALSSTLNLDEVFQILLEETRRLLDVIACSVWLIDQETNELVCQHATDPYRQVVSGWRLAPGQGLAGWVATHAESLIVPDTELDSRHFKGVDEQTGLPIRSVLTVPLRIKQSVIGVLQVVDEVVDRFEPVDLQLIESLAGVAANAVDNARLFAQLKDAQAQLIQRERLAALGQMAATVAHELRNPLMAIRMGVEYLLRDMPGGDPRQRGAALMKTNMERIDHIVEDILFVARSPEPRLTPGLLRPLIEEETGRWELTLANKNITLQQQLASDCPPIPFDRDQIARALSNLIGNSIHALSPGGQIDLTLIQKGDEQVITVADNGPGISPEHLPHIYEPFYTTKSRGAGLGLSVVKQIVDFHQGQIEVWSQSGKGTRFTITLSPDTS